MSFDQFVESLDNVPPELERNFNLMSKLDMKTNGLIKEINDCLANYKKARCRADRMQIRETSDELFERINSFADDKIELALQTYELIDKNIARLTHLGKGKVASTSTTCNGTGAWSGSKSGGNAMVKSDTTPIGFDMPLDPNEPTYCICRGVSHGDMVACDNRECPIEWFHYACVGLRAAPKGKWFCGQCYNVSSLRKKARSKRRR